MATIVELDPDAAEHHRSGGEHETGWKLELDKWLNRYAAKRVDGREAAERTRDLTRASLRKSFETLWVELGMKPLPHNLKDSHVRSLVRHWYFEQKKQVKTMETDLSILRKFSRWINRPHLVKPLAAYLPELEAELLVVSSLGGGSKAWSSNGINVERKIGQAFALDERFGLILLAQVAYGLTVQEALSLQPWMADTGAGLHVFSGDGPGRRRKRHIQYVIAEQRAVMDLIKQCVKKTHKLGWQKTRRGKPTTLKSNTHEYYARMEDIGMTKKTAGAVGDGLRAEYVLNMSAVEGFDPVSGYYDGQILPWIGSTVPVVETDEQDESNWRQIIVSYFRAFRRDAAGNVAYVGAAAGGNQCIPSGAECTPESVQPHVASRSPEPASGLTVMRASSPCARARRHRR
ncbi:hypothetical protein [Paraburkholderia sp. J7]|uniref:hypothetical protein n=1 Tax=Paraburkholderia sp. J7 TaxID=2805438 RepID=UPI002AB6FD79|nr:hypothetical protein [Paraburkholderia sp. J7]